MTHCLFLDINFIALNHYCCYQYWEAINSTNTLTCHVTMRIQGVPKTELMNKTNLSALLVLLCPIKFQTPCRWKHSERIYTGCLKFYGQCKHTVFSFVLVLVLCETLKRNQIELRHPADGYNVCTYTGCFNVFSLVHVSI